MQLLNHNYTKIRQNFTTLTQRKLQKRKTAVYKEFKGR